ncbi:MAG: DUF61 family protein [Candidatus Thorarchaeota archaeon]
MSDRILDLIWNLDIEKMNENLPVENKTLKELLADDKPSVKTKKNQIHKIRKVDLEFIATFFPENEWQNVRFPIILLRRTGLQKGLFSVSGGKNELFAVFRIVGKTEQTLSQFLLEDHQPYIWKPEAFTAMRKASTLFIIGYT